MHAEPRRTEVEVEAGVRLAGTLTTTGTEPASGSGGLVLFAHGSGSGRHSPRNRTVADALVEAGYATLLFDLLTPGEEAGERESGGLRFDIGLLAERLTAAVDWASAETQWGKGALALFGASTGAAAALTTAAERPDHIAAVVSRGGRPDLSSAPLENVRAPVRLIVGGDDTEVLRLNEAAAGALTGAHHDVSIIPGATHLFPEPGALDQVARLAVDWLDQHLGMDRP